MKQLFNPKMISMLILIIGVALVVKIGWFVVELTCLNAKGVEFSKPSSVKALYYRTRFASQHLKQNRTVRPTILADTIESIKLIAIYRSDERVVITVSKKGKTSVLVKNQGIGDEIDGYTLDGATATEALFVRDGKLYRIELVKSSNTKSSVSYANSEPNDNSSTQTKEIVNIDGITTINKSLLKRYSQNMDDIWKNIGINEKKVDGKTVGFKVNFVKKGSDFAKLGLRRGDLILAINGDALNSYAKALEVYQNIQNIENLTLRVQRGKEEMELEYEFE